MLRTDDRSYYRQRASKERAMASTSPDRSAAFIHLQLAEEYDRRAEARQAVGRGP